MAVKPRFGPVSLAVLLVLVGAGGGLVVPRVLERISPSDGTRPAEAAEGEDGRAVAGRRARPHVERDAERGGGAEQADGTADAARAAVGDGRGAELDPAEIDRVIAELQRRLGMSTGLKQTVVPANFAIHATPDREDATAEVREIEVGEPDEMELLAFVRRGGADSLHDAVELVGERRPRLAKGEPVALAGRVVDAEAGQPVIGARVVVTSTFYSRQYFYDHHLREVAHTVTDGDGAFLIERLNADPAHFGRGGRCYVSVSAEGFAPALAVPIAELSPGIANRLPDVRLERAAHSISGRVVDRRDGSPVAGARIVATGAIDPVAYPKDQREALFVGAPQTVTDAEGRFELTGLGRGMQTLSAHGGDDCIGRDAFALPREKEVTIRARQIRGRISGTTVDARGNPIPLVVVDGGGNSTHSFADGTFVLENFVGDVLQIRFAHADYHNLVVRDVADGEDALVVKLVDRRARIILDVKAADTGDALAHIVVTATFPAGANSGRPTSPHHFTQDGRHDVRVPDGATHLVVGAEGRAPEQIPLSGVVDGDVVPILLRPAGVDDTE